MESILIFAYFKSKHRTLILDKCLKKVADQCPGKILDIIGRDPSESKSNRLHVVIFLFLSSIIEIQSIDSSKMVCNFLAILIFNRSFLNSTDSSVINGRRLSAFILAGNPAPRTKAAAN